MERMDEAAAASSANRSFEDFFDAERARLLRALYLLTGNREEAEEVLQDAFLAIWERWDRVAGMEEPVGYLYRTALNTHRSRVRRGLRVARRAVGQAHGGDLFKEIEERDALARALADLSPRRREAVVLTGLAEISSSEAAEVMGVTDVTVRRLAQDARDQLRRSLSEADVDD
jgi:RNA polymerase sigma factor (sigma-70 family)